MRSATPHPSPTSHSRGLAIGLALAAVLAPSACILDVTGLSPPVQEPAKKPVCGDGKAEDPESCEGDDLRAQTCISLNRGYRGGALACTSSCSFDTSGCSFDAICGDNLIGGTEQCEGQDLADASCSTLGYIKGVLTCTSDCKFDESGCDDWFDAACPHRKRITIDPSRIEGTHERFPMLVVFTDAELAAHAAQDGSDIVFATRNGIALSHEIERYDSVSGTLWAWVSIPTLSPNDVPELFLYYGDPSCKPTTSPAEVWTPEEQGVWHLSETPQDELSGSLHADSTGAGHDGIQQGNAGVLGMIAGAQEFDGIDDSIDISLPDSIELGAGNYTISAWVLGYTPGERGIVHKSNTLVHEKNDKLFGMGHNGKVLGFDHGWVDYVGGQVDVFDAKWHHVAITQEKDMTGDKERWTLYVDGAVDRQHVTISPTAPDVVGHTLRIGTGTLGSYFPLPFSGVIDEVRISRVVRSPAFIRTSYTNQRLPQSFVSAGAEETR